MMEDILPDEYTWFFTEIKDKINRARISTAKSINREMALLYWSIGKEIYTAQRERGWGSKVVEQLSRDLQNEYPESTGYSKRNLLFMRSLYLAFPDQEIVKQVVSQMPWGHTIRLIQMVKEPQTRVWYAIETGRMGWTRSEMEKAVLSKLHERKDRGQSNYTQALRNENIPIDSFSIIKDPYVLDFVHFLKEPEERELERVLVENIRSFLLELGTGFSFVGNQVKINVAGTDYFIDLLFYHIKLHSYVVVELKTKEFKPEFLGKMNFYLSAVDDQLKGPLDNPTIGLLLCKDKDELKVEYTLRDMVKPMGISSYELKIINEKLPELIGMREKGIVRKG